MVTLFEGSIGVLFAIIIALIWYLIRVVNKLNREIGEVKGELRVIRRLIINNREGENK